MDAVGEILQRADTWVAPPEWPFCVMDDAAGSIPAVLHLIGDITPAAHAVIAAVTACSVLLWNLPGGDKFLGGSCQRPAGQPEVITGVPVIVTAQAAQPATVDIGDSDKEEGGCVVENADSRGSVEDDVIPLLANAEVLVLCHQWEGVALRVHLEWRQVTRVTRSMESPVPLHGDSVDVEGNTHPPYNHGITTGITGSPPQLTLYPQMDTTTLFIVTTSLWGSPDLPSPPSSVPAPC